MLAAAMMVAACNFQPGSTGIANTFSLPSSQDGGMEVTELLELPASSASDIILTHKGYKSRYNPDAKIPVWVAYELTAEETTGEATREDCMFQMDPDYRRAQAKREDYSGSGWTKGHMACAADFQWSSDAMSETFYLTNICPQSEELNKGDWNYLERQTRRWAREFGKVWVVTGPLIGKGRYGTIGERKVVVPDAFFKALMVEDKGKYRTIAFVMGNDDRRYYLADCSMSVDELEQMTGLDFFAALPDDVEAVAEKGYTLSTWGIRSR